MENIFFCLLIGLLVLLVLFLSYKISNKTNLSTQQFHESQKNLQHQIAKLKDYYFEELSKLKDTHRAELHQEFEKGYKRGAEISKINVQITPFKRTVKKGTFISKSESYECGYKYQLFSNGLPCLEPKEVIIDSISVKEINEENVNNLLEKFNNVIDKIPNTNLQLAETLNSFKSGLLALSKK